MVEQFDSGWHVQSQESDGNLAVTKGDLNLHIERDAAGIAPLGHRHLQPADQSAAVDDSVAMCMPRNLV